MLLVESGEPCSLQLYHVARVPRSVFLGSGLELTVLGSGRLYTNVQRFRGGLVFKAHRVLYRSNLGLKGITKTRRA